MKSFPKFNPVLSLAILCLAFSLGSVFGQTPPSNDDCSNATLIVPGSQNATIAGTTVGANVSNAAFCGATVSSPAVWYKVIGNGGPITISTCGQAMFDTKVSVYTGNCNSLQCINGNDDGPNCTNFTSELTFSSTTAQEYFIMVHGFGNLSGPFNLSIWTPTISVSNDDCNDATNITAAITTSSVSGTTIGATTDNAPSIAGVSVTAPGVWYSVTGTGGKIRLSTCGTTAWDTRLSVYTGTCSNLVGEVANDDHCGTGSEVTINSIQGVDYKILVHGFGAAAGNFNLDFIALVPPANDQPVNAINLIPGVAAIAFDNTNGTADQNEAVPGPGSNPSSCQRQDGWCAFETHVQNSIWYTFNAPSSGCVSILAGGFDTQLALYEVSDVNDYDTYRRIAANDDAGAQLGGTNRSSAWIQQATCLTPGATYYVQVDGFNGAEGQGTIQVTDCGGSPLTIEAGDCQSLFSGYGPTNNDIAYLRANVSGGFPPYIVRWGTDPSILYENRDFNGIAVQPSQSTAYTVSVTDDKGCTVTDIVTVTVEDVAICTFAPAAGSHRTQNQATFGGGVRTTTGAYLHNNFAAAFPNGLTIGCNNSMTLTSATAIRSFLPSSGQPMPMIQNYMDPISTGRFCLANNLAGNMVALALNIGFDQFDPNYSPSDLALADLTIDSGPFANMKVSDLYIMGEKSLGGCQAAYNPALISDAIQSINENFLNGNTAGGFLLEPGVSICNGSNSICTSQTDAAGLLNQGYVLGSCQNTCRATVASFPPPPPCFTWTLTITGDVFADLENSWMLRDITSGGLPIAPQTTVKGLITETYSFCLDSTHCYQWDIFDLLGDGFSYGGSYSISYLGNTIHSTFTDSLNNQILMESHTFGSACGGSKTNQLGSASTLDVVAYPNPFNDQAFIDFRMEETSHVTLEVYAITGQKVAVLFDGIAEANRPYSTTLQSDGLQNGLYFYKLYNDRGYSKEGKLVLQK